MEVPLFKAIISFRELLVYRIEICQLIREKDYGKVYLPNCEDRYTATPQIYVCLAYGIVVCGLGDKSTGEHWECTPLYLNHRTGYYLMLSEEGITNLATGNVFVNCNKYLTDGTAYHS